MTLLTLIIIINKDLSFFSYSKCKARGFYLSIPYLYWNNRNRIIGINNPAGHQVQGRGEGLDGDPEI